jgi:hypothetical protein
MIDAPDDVAGRHVRPPFIRLPWRSVFVGLPPREGARTRCREEVSQAEAGHLDDAPRKQGIAPDTVAEPRLPLHDQHPEPRSGQSDAERGSSNAAADHDDIKDRRSHESAPVLARRSPGDVSRRRIIRLGF